MHLHINCFLLKCKHFIFGQACLHPLFISYFLCSNTHSDTAHFDILVVLFTSKYFKNYDILRSTLTLTSFFINFLKFFLKYLNL